MIFQSLRITDFGVFRGQHTFDLTPVNRPDGIRRLIVISGHNGSGKSTLFQALAVAFYGSLALGNKVSRQDYSDFLASRLHRHGTVDRLETSNEAGIEVNFQYVQYGRPSHIQVKRHWHRGSSNVTESLSILQDGYPPDVEADDYQTWLSDLIPPGLLPLYFFDAEQLSALASPEDHDGSLREIFYRLLGIDLVERLQADLGYYTRRHGGGGPRADQLATEVAEQQAAVDKLDAQFHELQIESEKLGAKRDGLESELEKQELRLASEGGAYAAQRPKLQERLTTVQSEIELILNQLRDLCAGLLPFTLAPDLCRILGERLTQEAELHRRRIAGDLWREKTSKFETVLLGDDFWRGIELSPDIRQDLIQRLIHTMQEAESSETSAEKPLIHRVAESEHEQLQEWIAEVLHSIPQQVQELSEKLRQLQNEKKRIADNLKKAPDDDALVPIRNEISELEASIETLDQQKTTLDERVESIQSQLDEEQRQLQRVIDALEAAQASERRLALTEHSKLVLRTYKDALARQRLSVLAEALLTAFNTLCRKEHLLEAVHIDPDDFRTFLSGVSDNELDLEDFSAGERQLYAMALLWALRQISGRQLPLVIDTPLARMDEVHRSRLLVRYFPSVSDQVILFSTDTGLDAGMLAQVEPHLARSYQLNYNAHSGETIVTCNNGESVEEL